VAAPVTLPRRTRVHGSVPARTTTAASRVATAAAVTGQRAHARPTVTLVQARPELRIVARRRRALGLAVAGFVLLFGLMLGATALQTRLAQNQLQLDRLERDLAAAKETYDVLRRQRAELRSPERLMIEAGALGMVRGETADFVSVPPDIAAQVAVSTSGLPEEGRGAPDPLDEFRDVKAVAGGAP
jgi:hypothetical protein